ncbi:MAG TPA: ATP-dependent Clp protease proteolytic subunit [Acidimicrobiales bacterium]|nr:ATP-dependent Clp protease proteolytic subunit [Acidimicrobiales bacterium]
MDDFTFEVQRKMFDRRMVFLRGELDDGLAGRVAAQLMMLDANGDDDIELYVDSGGGTLEGAFTVMDTIDLLGIDVIATCVGRVEGPAVGVVAVAHQRRATPNVRFRLSQPNHTISGRASDLETWVQHQADQLRRYAGRVATATRQPPEHVEAALEVSRYMSAEEALHYRLIDEIVATARFDTPPRRPPGFRPSGTD